MFGLESKVGRVKRFLRNTVLASSMLIAGGLIASGISDRNSKISPMKNLGFENDTIKIASYNLLNYPGSDAAARNVFFKRTINAINPDVLVVQEMNSTAGVDNFRNNVMNSKQPNRYLSVPFHDGPDTDNSLFFDSSKVDFLGATYIPTALRDIAEYKLLIKGTSDTIRVYSMHLKASQGFESDRLAEATILRNHLNSLPVGSQFILTGDYNLYTSTEPAFQKLIGSEADDDGRSRDPINSVGNWNNNSAFKAIHTQSPRVRAFGGGSTGGMDDRFDIMLISYSSLDDNILSSTYTAFGNDGNHFNDSINRLPNSAVPDSIANALHYGSDHLPVFCKYVFLKPVVGDNITIDVPIQDRWNILSNPFSNGLRKNDAFPQASSNAYYYDGSGYVLAETLKHGKGYWLKFNSIDTVSITGIAGNDSVEVFEGWNLVGGIEKDVAIADISSIPAGIEGSSFFAYANGYNASDVISKGKGYWIKMNSPGILIFGGSQASNKLKIVPTNEMPPSLQELLNTAPTEYALHQNYPNPFNNSTKIEYKLPEDASVKISVYNSLGQIIREIDEGTKSSGTHNTTLSLPEYGSGIYIYKMQTITRDGELRVESKKMILMK